MPRGVSPDEKPPQMEMLPGKKLSYSLRPVWEDATDEKEKNHEQWYRENSVAHVPFPLSVCSVLQPCSSPCLPKFVAIALLQHPFDIRGAVEDLAAQLDVGNPSLIAVIL